LHKIVYLKDITSKHIEEFKIYRQKRISPRSINTEIAILGALFNKAMEWGYINVSPFKKVKMFKTPTRPPRFLSNEEINTLFDHSGRNIQNNGCYLALHRV
jgi:site-specific recombinase XerD